MPVCLLRPLLLPTGLLTVLVLVVPGTTPAHPHAAELKRVRAWPWMPVLRQLPGGKRVKGFTLSLRAIHD